MKFGAEREVFFHILVAHPELKAVAGAVAGELDGNEEDRGAMRDLGVRSVVPFELPDGEVQDVNARFLDGGHRVSGKIEQPPLEHFGSKVGLQAGVGVPFGEAGDRVNWVIGGRQGGFVFGGRFDGRDLRIAGANRWCLSPGSELR